MALRCTLLLLSLACATGIIAAERRAKDSCMVHWIVQSGVSHVKAVNIEKRMIQVDSSPVDVTATLSKFVSFLLKTTLADSNKLRSCFAGTSKACRKYSPCKHGGKCRTSLSKKQHVCDCPLDYTGNFCQIPHPAPLRDLRLLEKNFHKLSSTVKKLAAHPAPLKDLRLLEKKVKELTAATKKEVKAVSKDVKSLRKTQVNHGRLWKCHYPFVARKHVTWNSKPSDLDNGQLRSVKFFKKQENTVLRLLYSSNIREYNQHHSHWYFKIDGQECSRPGPIKIEMHHYRKNNLHIPSVLIGTCKATSRGRIGKGRHTISVHIKSSDGYSGYASTSFLEIREICQ